jgi:hypothetical protein
MALKLIANYSKRLGLPGYSSHQFSVSVETEISNINDVAGESTRLYQTLQTSVDEEVQKTGFVPDHGYGMEEGKSPATNGHQNGHHWNCSDKQRELILKLVDLRLAVAISFSSPETHGVSSTRSPRSTSPSTPTRPSIVEKPSTGSSTGSWG